ncbi:ion channel protein [Herbidospora sp. NBRC 101105]|uniref:ion channel protein n=1 Tax=Herbidospora sp. NBRC 101105 TaxID=3032195 RepID=UPI00249FF4C8|nr:ion channel protein [Herbidospora sp. NBRC 101105]GLX97996.1 putative ion-transport protein [Herbidospora sp. NBRC 101105]
MPRATWIRLLALVLPALVVGVGSSLILFGVTALAEWLERLIWPSFEWWRILVVLTLAGTVTGLLIWRFPGHAGPDPATEGLVAPPMPPRVLPGVLVAVIVTLSCGVSLGPENPITAVNVALAFAAGRRLFPQADGVVWVGIGAAGTVGALFGTPLAAALLMSELPLGRPETPLWDRLFAPLLAASAGALTTVALSGRTLYMKVPGYPGFRLADLVSGPVIALVGAGLGLLVVYAFPYAHAAFHRIPHPVLMVTAGGVVLGGLGIIGGEVSMFKGLTQAGELLRGHAATGTVILVLLVKLVALTVAAACGFRGGRIFPAVFMGIALGVAANALVPAVPPALALTAGVLGFVLAITQHGWLSLFISVAVVGDTALIPVACVTILPAWLLVTGKKQMVVPAHMPGMP